MFVAEGDLGGADADEGEPGRSGAVNFGRAVGGGGGEIGTSTPSASECLLEGLDESRSRSLGTDIVEPIRVRWVPASRQRDELKADTRAKRMYIPLLMKPSLVQSGAR